MKKSTKIISTAIAIVLVMSFMVVGILAATSASANVSASVSWTATEGLDFHCNIWSYQSTTTNSVSISVDTTTTNSQASGITKQLNLTFSDSTPNDGVNNPEPIYLFFMLCNTSGTTNDIGVVEGGIVVDMQFTDIPQANEYITLEYAIAYLDSYVLEEDSYYVSQANDYNAWSSGNFSLCEYPQYGGDFPPSQLGLVRLTIKNPDVSFSGVNLNWGLSFS